MAPNLFGRRRHGAQRDAATLGSCFAAFPGVKQRRWPGSFFVLETEHPTVAHLLRSEPPRGAKARELGNDLVGLADDAEGRRG